MSKIVVIVGSLRRESINRKLADALTKLAKPGTAVHASPGSMTCRCSARISSRARRRQSPA